MVCIMPINMSTFTLKEKIRMVNVEELYIHCDIEKKSLLDIIKFTFSKYGEFTMFGYNNRSSEFWAKKIKKNIYSLNFTLEIIVNELSTSTIVIRPIIGDKMEYTKIYNIIIDMIKSYQPGFSYSRFE